MYVDLLGRLTKMNTTLLTSLTFRSNEKDYPSIFVELFLKSRYRWVLGKQMRSKEQIESDYSIIPPMLHVSFTDSDGIRKKIMTGSWEEKSRI